MRQTKPPSEAGVGERLKARREAQRMTIDDVVYEIRALVTAPYRPSRSALSRWEQGQVAESDLDPVTVAALARVYGCTVSDLSPTAAERLETVRTLVNSSKSCSDSQTLETPFSGVAA